MTRIPFSILLAAFAANAFANGYQNLHQSAQGLGTAYAANGASISDVSAIFSNPASITRFPGVNMSLGSTVILPDDSFENLSAELENGTAVTGMPEVPTQFLDTSFSAYWYITRQHSDELFFGLAFNAPWATESDYTSTAVSRYTATTTSLTALNLNPMVGYKVSDRLSVAGGINLQYYLSEFATDIPTSTTDPSAETDIESQFDGNDFSLGFNIGVEWQASKAWRLGAAYRSAIGHDFDGNVSLNGSDAAFANLVLAITGLTRSGGASYSIDTPWMLQLGSHYQHTPKLEVYFSATLTGWSEFRDTIITTTNGLGTLTVLNDWDDAWYIAAGLGYQVSNKTRVFGGAAHDDTPTPTSVRNPRAPNADRFYVGLGLAHEFDPGRTVNFVYSHTFFDDAPIRLDNTNNPGRGVLMGDIVIDADIFMLQYVHQF